MAKIRSWVVAARLRTLPLAVSAIGMGGIIAYFYNSFNGVVFSLCVLTTILLQVLSNFANDYGDFVHGADSDHREGPNRMVQSGSISSSSMKAGITITGIFSLITGFILLKVAFGSISLLFVIFFILGIFSILAAIKYTAGKNPYGYQGFGDLFVFLFFGLVAVIGTCFLQTSFFKWTFILPATSMGFLSAGVLNVNNIRDIESDKMAGKASIPVRIGIENARIYHGFLLFAGYVLPLIFLAIEGVGVELFVPVLALPLFYNNFINVWRKEGKELDGYLKQLALSTLIYVLLIALGVSFYKYALFK